MANPLFTAFNGNQNGDNSQFGNQFSMFVNGLDKSVRDAPMQTVQKLMNSGQMTQNQFEQFRQIANRLTGKNY